MGRYYNQDSYLLHSSGPWKKHKYTSKKRGKKGWIYYYESEKDARSEFSRFEDWLGMDEKKIAENLKKLIVEHQLDC